MCLAAVGRGMDSEPILVTGSTGFVGRALVRDLIASGVAVTRLRLLVRDVAAARHSGLPASALVAGDLGSDSLRAAAAGVGLTFHVAGAVKALSRRGFIEANASGTAHLLDCLRRAAAGSRVVVVSSLAAAGPSVDGAGSASPPESARPRSHYGESKRLAELQLRACTGDLSWIVLRPPVVYGPGDTATRLLLRQATASRVLVPRTPRPLSVVHVDDVVRALRLAASGSASGVFLPIDGPQRLDTDALMVGMARACGREARLLRVPDVLQWPAGLAAELWCLIRRRPGHFGLDKLRDLRAPGWVADGEPIRRMLGFEPRTTHDAGFRATALAEGFAMGATAT